ncbi:poly(glycerophosphate chain) D-alanine transfer protein [Dickeya parazeae Ech586]|uniref:Poly(Glycerophosphate chain) D-alanine transfer protein n=1 Tax=Dickeya zeae (strain Ech586) TaxID=590409 RepID=D2BUZ1_DICZ5|nr:D-alanyl-lipoteichoic acid biosynthesis protein DltD [Dickeya parazeae]ACZ78059.1 poly(glycerophosphate chain) D-alanine transfer protein [Dickeya parazeae Ech586]
MKKLKNTICLHLLMATLAILVLSVPPLVTSFDPPLNFQPLIKSLDGTPKELKEKMATISHALQGNAIFFIGASEVSTSEDEHYAVYNYFNNQLRRPVVAYGDIYIDNIAHFLLLSRFKNDLNANSKVVLQLAPDSFYGDGVPGAVFADNFPPSIFNPLMDDPEPRRFLVSYLQNLNIDEVSHLTFAQMRVYGWHPQIIWQEVSYQFAIFCEMIKKDWLARLGIEPQPVRPWPVKPSPDIVPNWDNELANAHELNKSRQQSAATFWMDKSVYDDDPTQDVWDDAPLFPAQMDAFQATIKLLKERHVQVVVIVDAINPWAIKNSEKFQSIDKQIRSMLDENQVPYLDMYAMPYQNGWNWDRLHPTDPAWVVMDRFIAESFK